MKNDNITFDYQSSRSKDENGFLHVRTSHISKETVNPYYGEEIPHYKEQGLDPNRIYYGYRQGSELAKGAKTFNGLPLLLGHYAESAETPQREHRVGSLGTDACFTAPYLDNSLIITDAKAIASIENGTTRQISCAYRYEPVFIKGEFQGQPYDFIMTNIRGNHAALVEEGRAGNDVAVADSALQKCSPSLQQNTNMVLGNGEKLNHAGLSTREGGHLNTQPQHEGINHMGKFTTLAKKFLQKSGLQTDNSNVVEAAENFVQSIGEEMAEQMVKNSPNFEEQTKEILQNTTMEADKKIEALTALSEKTTKPAEQDAPSNKEGQTKDSQTATQQALTQQTAAPASKTELDALMQKAGIDPLDEAAKAIFVAALTALRTDEKEKSNKEEKEQLQDAAAIREQAKQEATIETKNHIKNLAEAARNVRNLCGELDPFSFDSANDIYRHALKSTGRNVATNDSAALKEMVNMAMDAKIIVTKSNTSPSQLEGKFRHLGKISIQQ